MKMTNKKPHEQNVKITESMDIFESDIPVEEKIISVKEETFVPKNTKKTKESKETTPCTCAHTEKYKSDKMSDEKKERMDKDLRKISGIFKNYESPGETITFFTRKYLEEGSQQKHVLKDGAVVELPYYVAEDIAVNAYIPIDQRYKSTDGKETYKVGSKIKRYDFFPRGEIVDWDIQPDILTVTR